MNTFAETLQIEQPRPRTRTELQEPALLMRTASRRVSTWFTTLEERHNITAGEVMAYLLQREPGIKERLDRLWDLVDSDVQGRYLEGVLDESDFRIWRQNLREWLSLLHAALALVRLHRSNAPEGDFALTGSALAPAAA